MWKAYPHSHHHTFLTITLPCSLFQNKTRHRRAKQDSWAVATQHSCAFHTPSVPTYRLGKHQSIIGTSENSRLSTNTSNPSKFLSLHHISRVWAQERAKLRLQEIWGYPQQKMSPVTQPPADAVSTATAGNRNSHPLGTFQLHQGIQDRTYTRWGVTSNWRRCLLPQSAPRGATNDSSFGAGRHWEKEGCGAEPLPSPSPPGPDSPVPLVPLS